MPWCFHVAGASPWLPSDAATDTAADPPPSNRSVRLLGADGRIRIQHLPVSAGDLMDAHPLHLLCRSDGLVIGQPVPCLAPEEFLLPGRTYFLLPAHLFRPATPLSFSSLASCLGDFLKRSGGCSPIRPIEFQKTPAGRLQVRVSDEYLDRLAEEEAAEERRGRGVCTTEELAKDYKQLVRCRSWKPKLETIKESERSRGIWGGIEIFERRIRYADCYPTSDVEHDDAVAIRGGDGHVAIIDLVPHEAEKKGVEVRTLVDERWCYACYEGCIALSSDEFVEMLVVDGIPLC
ncbi:hypothetical protein ZIOFF_011080 [Zingiber officinale]|uniref:Uncharacterized protein n=1 Tax=Zingiber officinale TaxID=94328 RepID=A0A8J5LSH6_ZINOF|nr:hypothetical protein ZIOFF_011080 [Zingiber officinale]